MLFFFPHITCNQALALKVHYLQLSLLYQLARSEKLKPLEVELRRLEDLSKSIVDDFAYMRSREEQMRDTNGLFGGFFFFFFWSKPYL